MKGFTKFCAYKLGECYTYGCRITYHCGDGYELVGKQAADCQSDGTWSAKEIPTCVCKNPRDNVS